SDYRGERIEIPTKKPRKSQKNPNPQLSDEQKAANTALSQVRIFIEHAIGGMKRYTILVHVFPNRKVEFEDDAVGICAGLWNFALSYSGTTLLSMMAMTLSLFWCLCPAYPLPSPLFWPRCSSRRHGVCWCDAV